MKGVPMRVETTMRRWRMALVAVAGLCGLGAAVVAAGPSSPAVAAQQDVVVDLINGNDPLTKFAKLMKVVSHPRCVNCHGGSNPFEGINHPPNVMLPEVAARIRDANGDHDFGPPENSAVCVSCHNLHPTAWVLAHRFSSFKDQTPRQICALWKYAQIGPGKVVDSAQALLTHLDTDDLIAIGFLGDKNVDDSGGEPVRVEKPPMDSDEFMKDAKEWLRGSTDIPCAGWVGTITQTESVSEETTANGLPGLSAATIHEKQTATRTVTVTINGGVKVAITLSATDSIENNMNVPGCTAVGRSVATIRPKSGSTAIDDAKSARIRFSPDGKYTISIQLPDEVNERTEASEFQQCVLGLMKETPTVVELPHIGWSIDMDGTLSNPSDRTELIGKPDPVIRTGDDAWLTGSGGVIQPFQVEGSQNRPVSVTVTTTWNLRRVP